MSGAAIDADAPSRRGLAAPALVLLSAPESNAATAYHLLHDRLSAVAATRADSASRVLLITGVREDDAGPACAVNLALAAAEVNDAPVLLVEADIRRPRLASLLALETDATDQTAGHLCAHLEHDRGAPLPAVTVGECGLQVAAIGPTETRPARLNLPALEALLDRARAAGYGWILVSAAPVLGYADALLVAECADVILLAVAAGTTSVAQVRAATQELGAERVTGVVLIDA